MRNSLYVSFILALAVMTIASACSASSANLASVKTGKDKDVTQLSSDFKAGDTIYANASVANNPGKVTVKIYITVDEAPGMTKGTTVPNSEVSMLVDGDGTVRYSFATVATTKGGKFNVVADMMDENGQKKDTKSEPITVGAGEAPGSGLSNDKPGD